MGNKTANSYVLSLPFIAIALPLYSTLYIASLAMTCIGSVLQIASNITYYTCMLAGVVTGLIPSFALRLLNLSDSCLDKHCSNTNLVYIVKDISILNAKTSDNPKITDCDDLRRLKKERINSLYHAQIEAITQQIILEEDKIHEEHEPTFNPNRGFRY